MIQDDRIGIGYGLLNLTEDPAFMSFDGAKFILKEEALKGHLSSIANAGANFLRVLPWGVGMRHSHGKAGRFQPYVLDVSRDRWDLSSFNDYYFVLFRHIIEIANGLGLTMMFCWFDNGQLSGKYRQWSPWFSNLNGIESFYKVNADRYVRTWIETCIDEFKGLELIYALGNELEHPAFPEMAKRAIFPIIREKNIDFNRLTYGATMTSVPYLGNNTYPQAASTIQDLVKKLIDNEFGEEAELKVYMEIYGCGGPPAGAERPYGAHVDQALYWWGRQPIRKIFSDDGVWDGDSPCDREAQTGRARPSANTWGRMASHILLNYPYRLSGRDCLLNFEHIPKGGDVACQVATMRAISKAYCGRFGNWPANYGKHFYVPPLEPPSPPAPAPPKMGHWIGWLRTLSVKRWWRRVFAGGKKPFE